MGCHCNCAGIRISLIQVIYRKAFFDRFYRNKMLQFVDLLSLSNVSMLIFSERYHGYYIHGRSVHPHADTDMHDMNVNLKKEEVDFLFRI